MVAIAGFSKDQILAAVRQMYTEVATLPSKQFHFPTGRDACLFVGYEIGLVGLSVAAGVPLGLPLLLTPLLALRQFQVLIGLLVGSLLAWMRVR